MYRYCKVIEMYNEDVIGTDTKSDMQTVVVMCLLVKM